MLICCSDMKESIFESKLLRNEYLNLIIEVGNRIWWS